MHVTSKTEGRDVPLLASMAFKLSSFRCPFPKSLAKFVGVKPGTMLDGLELNEEEAPPSTPLPLPR